jgi:exodeoxyribonuclease VII small subunit
MKKGEYIMKEKRNFEDAMHELEEIVEKLENGELSLDESVEYFQKGVELSKYCSKRLDEIERKITVLIEDEKGNLKEEPFDLGKVSEA